LLKTPTTHPLVWVKSWIYILLINYIFKEYTSARSPSDFCNRIESPALPLPVDQNGNVVYNLHLNVNQTTQFQFDLNYQPTPPSVPSKPILDIDLNSSPPPDYD